MYRLVALMLLLCAATTGAAPALTTADLVNTRVMVLGDSITHGGQWVSFLQYYLLKAHPDADVDVISIGLGSETASGLSEEDHPFPRPCVHERLERALKAVQPKVVIACYGMNDGIYHPASPERDQAYRDGITKLVEVSKAHGVERFLLLSPGVYDGRSQNVTPPFGYKTPFKDYDQVLAGYAKLLATFEIDGVATADLHTPMRAFSNLKKQTNPKFTLARDGIHPQTLGHFIMARAAMAGLGVPLPEDFEKELQAVAADPLYKLAHQHRSTRSKGWLPYVGYTRGKTVKSNAIEPTEEQCTKLMARINQLRRQ